MNTATLLQNLPSPWPEDLQPENRERALASNRTIVVLDDDPTGTQTVFDVPVITDWPGDHLVDAFREKLPLVYVLTNSRSFPADEAERINREVARAILIAMGETGRDFAVISRSDSTLRGHFPLETDTLAEELEMQHAPLILAPFFEEGGRFTIDGVHYVVEGDTATPAAETPFADDPVFGFANSDLRKWTEEKTGGRVPAKQVLNISLKVIREDGPNGVEAILRGLPERSVCVVDAVEMRDMEVIAAAVHRLWGDGRMLLFRTAASIVRALAGLPKKPLLDREEVIDSNGSGGLIAVGSHVPKTTAQLEALVRESDVAVVELNVADIDIASVRASVDSALREGKNVVLYTSRELLTGSTDEENLAIGQRISNALVDIVRDLDVDPGFLIVKGGITSSDIATKALGIRRGLVLGQLLPGVPVWRAESGLGLVVFPGNVGDDNALLEAVRRLSE